MMIDEDAQFGQKHTFVLFKGLSVTLYFAGFHACFEWINSKYCNIMTYSTRPDRPLIIRLPFSFLFLYFFYYGFK